MQKNKFTIGIVIGVTLGISVLLPSTQLVHADSQSDGVIINATVPAGAVCGNGVVEGAEECDLGGANGTCPSATCSVGCNILTCGGNSGDGTPPVIADVIVTPSSTGAIITWVATDNVGISSCELEYGLTNSYGSDAAVTSGDLINFTGSIYSLTTSTEYLYEIVCRDTSSNSDTHADSFVTGFTLVPVNLTVLVTPEKRVSRDGGNLDLDFTLIVNDPSVVVTPYQFSGRTGANGQYIEVNALMPQGTNLDVILKGRSHLAKKIVGVNIADGDDIVLDFTDGGLFEVKAGDVAGSGLKDNFVDILDMSDVTLNVNGIDVDADLNADDIVDVLDISIVLTNFNQGGDPLP